MISSMAQAGRTGSRQKSLSMLLALVYILVALISSAHFHELHEQKNVQAVDFSPAVVSLYQEIILEDHAEHWHSDQHNCASCKLQNTGLAVDFFYSPVDVKAPLDSHRSNVSRTFNNIPSLHQPRAPPVPVV